MLRSLSDAGKTTWASHIKNLLFEHDFGYAWIADSVGNTNSFLNIFSQRIKDILLQTWRQSINDSPKADYYKYFRAQGQASGGEKPDSAEKTHTPKRVDRSTDVRRTADKKE